MRFTVPELFAVVCCAFFVVFASHCAAGPTVKTVFDIAVSLCEITVKDHPELVPPGKAGDTICKDAEFLKPFLDQLLSAQKAAMAKTTGGELKPEVSSPSLAPEPAIPKD